MADFEALKAQGNAAFARDEFRDAVRLYGKALLLQPDSHIIFSNRSAAYLKKGDLADALADAEACVRLQPAWVKGYSRLASALVAMDRYSDCVEACRKGLALEPTNEALRECMAMCTTVLEKQAAEAQKQANLVAAANAAAAAGRGAVETRLKG